MVKLSSWSARNPTISQDALPRKKVPQSCLLMGIGEVLGRGGIDLKPPGAIHVPLGVPCVVGGILRLP